jgi:hypothetical protein
MKPAGSHDDSLRLRLPGEHRFRLLIAKMLFCPPAGATNPLE